MFHDATHGFSLQYGKPHKKKKKKSKLAKYGVPLAAGLGGAYVLNKATHGIGHGFGFHHGSGSSSSSSGSSCSGGSSDEE